MEKKYHNMIFTIAVTMTADNNMNGILYCPVVKSKLEFRNVSELFLKMDKIMEDWNIPKYDCRFRKYNNRYKYNIDQIEYIDGDTLNIDKSYALSKKSLKLYNYVFYVEVMRRQNYSWQGKITWIKKNKIRYFRSILELMKLMYSAQS